MMRADRDRELMLPLDWAIDGLFAGMLLFLPLAFGTTEAWSRQVWYLFVAAIGVCVLIKPFRHGTSGLRWSWTYAPMIAFLLLTLAQVLPLPRGLIEAISPNTLPLNRELLGSEDLRMPQITFYRWATVQQLQMVAAVCAIMVCVLQNYTRPAGIKRLLILVSAAGLVVALFATYQDLSRATMIFGLVPVGHPNAGPFQNYSHFSQFMNLSVGAALGLALMSVRGWASEGTRRREWLERFSESAGWPVAAALLFCIAGPVLVMLSMSRMGTLSTLIAGAITAALVGWRSERAGSRSTRGSKTVDYTFLSVGLGLAIFAVLLAVGFDVVYARVATLHDQMPVDTRWALLKSLLPAWRQFPIVGTGLGTHEYVFPMFSKLRIGGLATHAENEYAQLMEECGAIGLALALLFLAMILAAFLRAIWRPTLPIQFAAFGLGFGLCAILIHSFSDFGQHVPANATLTAITAGLLINIARLTRPEPMRTTVRASFRATAVQGLALGVFGIGMGVILWRSDVSRRAEAAWFDFHDAAAALKGRQPTDDDFRRMLAAASTAASLEPANVVYRYSVPSLRWQVVERDAVDVETREQRFSAEAVEFARLITSDLDALRPLCPAYGPPLCVAGQIRVLVLKEEAGRSDIELAYRLTPNDPVVCWTRGMLATWQKNWSTAQTAFDKFLALGGERFRVVDAYLLANRLDLAFEAALPDRANLRRLADGLAVWPHQEHLAADCRAAADQLLLKQSESSEAPPDIQMERGSYEASQGNTAQAVLWYQKAVDRNYGRVDWRLQLAQAQAKLNQYAAAVQNLKVCLRIRPKLPEAERLLGEYGIAATRSEPAPLTP